jgi:hypothetical protein
VKTSRLILVALVDYEPWSLKSSEDEIEQHQMRTGMPPSNFTKTKYFHQIYCGVTGSRIGLNALWSCLIAGRLGSRLRYTVFFQWTSADVAVLCRGRLDHNQLIDPTDDEGLTVRIIDRHPSIFTVSKGAPTCQTAAWICVPVLLPGPSVVALDDVSSGQ